MTDWQQTLTPMGIAAKAATATLGAAAASQRTALLTRAAALLRAGAAAILAANAVDVAAAQETLSAAMLDRLTLTPARVAAMAAGLEAVAAQPDPVGLVLAAWTRPNGLHIKRISVPLGVIGMIYESRPNVTAEAAAIALRGGNAIMLRCGSDCFASSAAIAEILRQALRETGLPEAAVQLVPTTDRAAVGALLNLGDYIDVIVPRGGRSLVERVERESRIPLLRQYEGVCHVYVDGEADAEKAVAITHNAKLRRTSICGAAECLLLDRAALPRLALPILKNLLDSGCAVHGDAELAALDPRITPATPQDWGREFLDAMIAARVVEGVEGAIGHINRYGSGHTDAIISENATTAARFCGGVTSAIAIHNASTQFADGAEFGFGGELGIATGKLHARGPIGAAQLTSYKYVVTGDGQTRP